jgi:hypothetical protein
VSHGQRDGSLRPYSRVSRPEPLLFLPSSSSVVLTRLSGPRYFSGNLVAPGIEPGTSGSVTVYATTSCVVSLRYCMFEKRVWDSFPCCERAVTNGGCVLLDCTCALTIFSWVIRQPVPSIHKTCKFCFPRTGPGSRTTRPPMCDDRTGIPTHLRSEPAPKVYKCDVLKLCLGLCTHLTQNECY